MERKVATMAITFMDPAVILFRGDVYRTLCVQASTPGTGATLELQAVDGNPLQLWQYGSDGRIYQYDGTGNPQICIDVAGEASQELQLITSAVDSSRLLQTWSLSTSAPSLTNNGAGNQYCMNDQGGNGNPGDAVIIFANTTTDNIEWAFAIYPSFPNQPTAG
jgi:hypothetical protein